MQESTNTACIPQKQDTDTKWKFCGYYTPLNGIDEQATVTEDPSQQSKITEIYEMEVQSQSFQYFTVIDIEQKKKQVANGVTIKFFFNYKDSGMKFDEVSGSSKNFLQQLYEKVIVQAFDPNKRGALYSKELLSFIPHVSNLTAGDDMSSRVYWEKDGIDIRLNKKDPILCPENQQKIFENC